MARLELESRSGEVIDLDGIVRNGIRVQALAGLTGFGLPAVSGQWAESAEDGATFRGSRVLARTLDLPIYVDVADRDALRGTLSRMATALAGPCILRFVEDNDEAWELVIYRTGGGDFASGIDTDNKTDLQTTISVQAGNPYWRRSVAKTHVSPPITSTYNVTVNVEGDAPTYPVITVKGPGRNVVLTSPTGEIFRWTGTLTTGHIVVDMANGTVVDHKGVSRYRQVTSPNFWRLPSGPQTYKVSIDNASAGWSADADADAHNFVRDPNATDASLWFGEGVELWPLSTPDADVSVNDGHLRHIVRGGGWASESSTQVSGLVVGKRYYFGATTYLTDVSGTSSIHLAQSVRVGDVVARASANDEGNLVDLRGSFVATETTAAFVPTSASSVNEDAQTLTEFWHLYVSEVDEFFSGSTADTSNYDYQWDGSPNESRTIRTTTNRPPSSGTSVTTRWYPQRWAVI